MRSLIEEATGGDKWTMIGVVLTGVISLIAGVWQIAKSFRKSVDDGFDTLNSNVVAINNKMEEQGKLVTHAIIGLDNVKERLDEHSERLEKHDGVLAKHEFRFGRIAGREE
jgi:hypothetical protein